MVRRSTLAIKWIYVLNNEAVDDNDPSISLFSWLAKQTKAQVAQQPVTTPEISTTTDSQVSSVKTDDTSNLELCMAVTLISALAFVAIKKKQLAN